MSIDPGPSLRVVVDLDRLRAEIAAEVRAEIARQRITQVKIAADVFGENQQWLSRRLTGDVGFEAGELAVLADYLGVPVGQFYGEQPTRPKPDGGHRVSGQVTVPYPAGHLLRLVA